MATVGRTSRVGTRSVRMSSRACCHSTSLDHALLVQQRQDALAARHGAQPAGRAEGVHRGGGLGDRREVGDLRPRQVLHRLVEVAAGRVGDPVDPVAVGGEAQVVGEQRLAAVAGGQEEGRAPPPPPCAAGSGAPGRCMRATCMARVEAPEIRWRRDRFCQAARPTARGSTPGCSQKRRSSIATVAATTLGGRASSGQYPSSASRPSPSSQRNAPWRSRSSRVGAGASSRARDKRDRHDAHGSHRHEHREALENSRESRVESRESSRPPGRAGLLPPWVGGGSCSTLDAQLSTPPAAPTSESQAGRRRGRRRPGPRWRRRTSSRPAPGAG